MQQGPRARAGAGLRDEQRAEELFGVLARRQARALAERRVDRMIELLRKFRQRNLARGANAGAGVAVQSLVEPALDSHAERCVARLFVRDASHQTSQLWLAGVLGLERCYQCAVQEAIAGSRTSAPWRRAMARVARVCRRSSRAARLNARSSGRGACRAERSARSCWKA